MKIKLGSCLLAFIGLTAGSASQAAWPERPITLIVPAAPGGTADISARLISEKLGAALGTTVVIENRAGAAGIIGSQALTRAAPDGYTLEMGNIGPNAINYSLYKTLPYKPTDFAPVSMVVTMSEKPAISMPWRSMPSSSTAITTPTMLPSPPKMLTPPSTTVVMVLSSSRSPMSGLTALE